MKEEMLVICAAQMQQMQYRLSKIDFGDSDRNHLRDELCEMADVLHSRGVKGIKNSERDKKKLFYEGLMKWMHFLITSNTTNVPTQMSYVLKKILYAWLGKGLDNLVVVFVEGDFSVTRFKKDPMGTSLFEASTGIKFSKDPVFVRIPHYYQEDMLFNIALFHELGHIVDEQLNLFYDVKESVIKATSGDVNKRIIREYFPILNVGRTFDEGVIDSYIKEYIADLFAAQYVGKYIIEYLDYLGEQTRIPDSKTHPHFDIRKKMVDDFINCENSKTRNTSNFLLQYIMESFAGAGKGNLTIRWKLIQGDDLLNDRPVVLADLDDLFSLFKHAWDVVYGGVNAVETARNIQLNTMSHYSFYDSLNKCVLDSVTQFMDSNLN